jgi:hypothetical protein
MLVATAIVPLAKDPREFGAFGNLDNGAKDFVDRLAQRAPPSSSAAKVRLGSGFQPQPSIYI